MDKVFALGQFDHLRIAFVVDSGPLSDPMSFGIALKMNR